MLAKTLAASDARPPYIQPLLILLIMKTFQSIPVSSNLLTHSIESNGESCTHRCHDSTFGLRRHQTSKSRMDEQYRHDRLS